MCAHTCTCVYTTVQLQLQLQWHHRDHLYTRGCLVAVLKFLLCKNTGSRTFSKLDLRGVPPSSCCHSDNYDGKERLGKGTQDLKTKGLVKDDSSLDNVGWFRPSQY